MLYLTLVIVFVVFAALVISLSRHRALILPFMMAASLVAMLVEAAGLLTLGRLFDDKVRFLAYFSVGVEEAIRLATLTIFYQKVLKGEKFGYWEGAFAGLSFGLFEHAARAISLFSGSQPSACLSADWPMICAYSLFVTPLLMHILLGALYAPVLGDKLKCGVVFTGSVVIHYAVNVGALNETYNPSQMFGTVGFSQFLSFILLLLIFILYLRTEWRRHS